MNNIYKNFIWWMGIVENRFDPKKMGRCQVRIVGYHTDDKTVLPTDDLPWALPVQPITSAAISGVGSSPLGPVEGTVVVGWFLDGEDMQQPAFFGCIGGISSKDKVFAEPAKKDIITNQKTGTLTDSSGAPVLDSSGKEIKVGTPNIDGWSLGKTSERYESGGRGPGTINNYTGGAAGDYGGASYGSYQFASYLPATMPSGKSRPSSSKSPLNAYIASSKYKNVFAGLTPATPAFDAKWKSIAAENSVAFAKDQHDYIQKNYYDVMLANLKRNGLDLSKFGPAVQDLIWSTAVQLGPGRTSVFTIPLKNKSELTDKFIVEVVSKYKIDNVNTFFASSSQAIKNSVKNRWESEKLELLKLIK